LSGCSFVFVSGPPEDHEKMTYFDCTSTRIPPGVDTFIALALAGLALDGAQMSDAEVAMYKSSRAAMVATPLAFASPFVGSAIFGFVQTGSCRSAKRQWA